MPSDFFLDPHRSKSYCLTLGKKNSLLLILNLPIGFCRSSWILQAEGGWAPLVSFNVVGPGWGLSLGYSNHRCPVSSSRPQSTVQPALSTLCIFTSLSLIIHLILQPSDQLVRCIDWEHTAPPLPLCWTGHHIGGPCIGAQFPH